MQSKILVAFFVLFCLSAASVQAQTKTIAPETMKQAVMQVDGITSGVVDKLWSETDVYWHHGDYYRIVDLCRLTVEAEPSFNEAYSAGAYLIWSLGDPKGADDLLEYGISRTKNKTELYADLGRHFNFTKRYDAAETYLKKAISFPDAGPVPYTQLAFSYKKRKMYPEAVKVWEQVVKKFPTFPSGPANLAGARAAAKGVDDAAKPDAKTP